MDPINRPAVQNTPASQANEPKSEPNKPEDQSLTVANPNAAVAVGDVPNGPQPTPGGAVSSAAPGAMGAFHNEGVTEFLNNGSTTVGA